VKDVRFAWACATIATALLPASSIAEDRMQNIILFCGQVRTVVEVAVEMKLDKRSPQDAYAFRKNGQDLAPMVSSDFKKHLINQVYFDPNFSGLNLGNASAVENQLYLDCIQTMKPGPQPHYEPLK